MCPCSQLEGQLSLSLKYIRDSKGDPKKPYCDGARARHLVRGSLRTWPHHLLLLLSLISS